MIPQKKESSFEAHTLGFSNRELLKLEEQPNIRIMALLYQIIKIYNNEKLAGFKLAGKRYVWISYKILLSKFSGFSYSDRMMARDLHKLEDFGLIKRTEKIYEGKKRIFFYITELTRSIYVFYIQN